MIIGMEYKHMDAAGLA